MVLKEHYNSYEGALLKLDMESLHERRNNLQLKFAKSGIKYDKLSDLLPERPKIRKIETRNYEKFNVDFAHTERLKNSSIIAMQRQLNSDYHQNKKRKWG